jgi:uncharacterized membrane protein
MSKLNYPVKVIAEIDGKLGAIIFDDEQSLISIRDKLNELMPPVELLEQYRKIGFDEGWNKRDIRH